MFVFVCRPCDTLLSCPGLDPTIRHFPGGVHLRAVLGVYLRFWSILKKTYPTSDPEHHTLAPSLPLVKLFNLDNFRPEDAAYLPEAYVVEGR